MVVGCGGGQWLKILVLGVVYYFGIKHGIGAESLAEFFEAIHLNHHVGTSVSSLRKLKQEMREGICVGGDETFFGLPILVLVELASGYIFTEVECENRTYATWSDQIQHWWLTGGWKCHFMVSDGAPALIKLALSGLACVSVTDLFHALRANRPTHWQCYRPSTKSLPAKSANTSTTRAQNYQSVQRRGNQAIPG